MQSPYQDTAAALPPVAAATPRVHRKITWKLTPNTKVKHGRKREAFVCEFAIVPVNTY